MRKKELHISRKAEFCHYMFFSSLSSLCPDVQGEGDAAQVAVSGRVVDDALPVEFALNLEVSVVLHSCETHRHHRRGVVHLWGRWQGSAGGR